jgi:hypothetical protein
MTIDLLERRPEQREKLKRSLRREKLLPSRSRKKKKGTKRKKPDLYVQLPLGILQNPPVRDYRTAGERHVTPFEFGVLVGVTRLAAQTYFGELHDRSFAWGGKLIERERVDGLNHYERWKRHQEQGRAPPRKGTSIKRTGQNAYQSKKRKVQPPEVLTVRCSRSAILKPTGLWFDGRNLAKVDKALDRLRQPVGNMPAPLLSWGNEDGQLLLEVSGEWLKAPYGRVPLPLPLRSSVATSQLLWIFSIAGSQGPRSRHKKLFQELCEIIGVPTSYGKQISGRAFDRAIKVLTEHLGEFRKAELASLRKPINIPDRYEFKPLKHGYVRLVAINDDDEQSEDEDKDCPT